MKQKYGLLLVIGIVFGLGAMSLVLAQNSISSPKKSKYKTYTNTTTGYSVKYPSTWRPHEQEYDKSFVYFDYGKDQISIPEQSTAVTIGPTKIGPDSIYQSSNLDEIAKTAIEMIEANRFGDQDLKIRVKNGKIRKIKAKRINYINSFVYAQKLEMVKYFFVKDDFVWTIEGPAKELKQIFKSFKFIPK